ncbi:MAG TPA: FAD-dependent oxidoreductase, partial [Desulfobulbaceae bacterium]|nr:FAD-dependent oxidoreductase [Desulfobulbaceae bacterium]
MSETVHQTSCSVAIIGSGPTGIAAALELKKSGINDIIILEREKEGGGVPRHCGHPPFGLHEYHRILTGPTYARRNI